MAQAVVITAPRVLFAITEMVGALCIAIAVDRALALVERSVEERAERLSRM